ncbi:MAG: hypothetical protein D6B28_04610 [Gammaproteobacteria bacterium]|nr:MAG: hypothetical protein D6B28_04610 [Gammaproteobacteria bacterium]
MKIEFSNKFDNNTFGFYTKRTDRVSGTLLIWLWDRISITAEKWEFFFKFIAQYLILLSIGL